MTHKKTMLDVLMTEGAEAFKEQIRRKEKWELAKVNFKRIEENKAEIESIFADEYTAALAEYETAKAAHQQKTASAQQTEADRTVGEVISKIASAFDDAFYAFLEASRLTAPAALQAQLAPRRRSYQEKVPTPPGEEILGLEQSLGRPSWMPWPPIQSEKTEGTWRFMIDWYGKGSAPTSPPTVHLRIDGVDAEMPKVSKLTMDPTANRIGFNVPGVEPTGFELEELKSGDLRFNVLTRKNNPG
jgi:hypothetical protein